jgi:hypothetical protein
MSDPRHSRQIRLAEIGDLGQERIESMQATIAGEGLGAVVEARYLAGAGVKRIACVSASVGEAAQAVDERVAIALAFPAGAEEKGPDFQIQDPAARDVALGAWRALAAIRRALEGRMA